MEMNNINKHVVILKNDAVGDLVHSLNAINNIVNDNNNLKITIFLSKLSEKFSFLIKNPKIEIRILNYDLSFNEKIKIFRFLSTNRIEKLYHQKIIIIIYLCFLKRLNFMQYVLMVQTIIEDHLNS